MLINKITSLEFSKKEKLFTELKKHIGISTKILVAVSGGIDSMFVSFVIYNFFVNENLNIENLFFVHMNHGVRDESEDEELFIKKIFGENLFVRRANSNDNIENNTEENMRNWRYKEFNKICIEKNIDFVVTGHHLNDRVESSFLHMLRGAGLRGFLSMGFCDTHHLLSSAKVFRPLLSFNKGEILAIVKKNNIPYVQDESNFDAKISKRNKLRNVVLPQLFELSNKNTDTENSFLESMKNVYNELSSYATETNETFACDLKDIELSPYRNAEWGYRLECLVDELKTDYLLDILKYLNVSQNVTKKNLSEIVGFLNKNTSGYKFLNGVTFFVAHGNKYLIKAKRRFWERFVEDDVSGIRYPKKGDKYNRKTRNQFCIKQRIPIFWRNYIPVVVKNGKIVEYEWNNKSV